MILVSYHFPPDSYYPDQTHQLKHSTFFLPALGPFGAFLIMNLPAMQETWIGKIPGLGRHLEKGMATHSSILAWRIPWTEKPGGLYSSWSHKELDLTEWLSRPLADLLFLLKLFFPYLHSLIFTRKSFEIRSNLVLISFFLAHLSTHSI